MQTNLFHLEQRCSQLEKNGATGYIHISTLSVASLALGHAAHSSSCMDSQQPPNVIPPANEAEYQHTRTNVIVATVICAVASTSSVAARFLVRRRRKQELRWDDWLMVMALLFAYVAIAGQFVGASASSSSLSARARKGQF